jgi:transglutaminase-like putative cysteine protease
MAYLTPCSHAGQSLLSHALAVYPSPALQKNAVDVFGNARTFISLQVPHDTLVVTAHSQVRTMACTQPQSAALWETTRETLRYQAGAVFDAASEFVYASPFVPRHPDFAAYARTCFEPGGTLLEATCALMQRIHTDFTYESQSTEVNTPALEALLARRGVCQDFAHIMLGCLRSLGLPGRYVSGYLLTQPEPGQIKLIGSDASHAWVSVYLADLPEGARWCDFDPTNNRWGWHAPGEDYVTLATGRDFGDVSPLRGVIHGGASHTLTVSVTVQELRENGDLFASQNPSQGQSQSQSQGMGLHQTQRQSTVI